ncbi:MAG TPA: type II secretion system F family protein [Candidatus Binatia bacterium]|nr:type II secretion system F family protein [Candidatus Binatia bacterium]
MDPTIVVVLSFVIVAGFTLLIGITLMRLWPAVRAGRLAGTAAGASGDASIFRWSDAPESGIRGILHHLGRSAAPRTEAGRSRYRSKLAWAGYHDPNALLLFVGAKVALALLVGSGYFIYGITVQRVLPNLFAVSLGLAAAGFFLPDFWLHNRIKARRREIVHALPDVLDMLTVCVEAGMGFDAAVTRVAEQPEARSSPLHQELRRTSLEVRAGRPRAEALRALGERTGAQEVKAVVGAFIQTEKLGTPLGKTLRIHAEAARVQRRHRAEERAHLAPLKMLGPTVFFLFPAFFLVALAPSLLNILALLKAIGGTR